jgi:hypothetical protein
VKQTTGEWVRVHETPTPEPDLADLPDGSVYTQAMDDYLNEHKAKLAAQKAEGITDEVRELIDIAITVRNAAKESDAAGYRRRVVDAPYERESACIHIAQAQQLRGRERRRRLAERAKLQAEIERLITYAVGP